tara:strand:+ start:142007 stop:142174 length:168 start_codon:yes stop_codon:yes gene_type:complete
MVALGIEALLELSRFFREATAESPTRRVTPKISKLFICVKIKKHPELPQDALHIY